VLIDRTENVWSPIASGPSFKGDWHDENGAPSSEHSNVAGTADDVNENSGEVL
jgi:hypothetical protein